MTSNDCSSRNITLVLNGAEARLQLVAGRGTELLFSQEWYTPRQGMKVLVPALVDALQRMDLTLSNLARIAIVRGPGSFTGLRLVLSTALGLARPQGIPMGGIGYLDALAADAAQLTDGPVWAVTHARRGQVHLQGFSGTLSDDLDSEEEDFAAENESSEFDTRYTADPSSAVSCTQSHETSGEATPCSMSRILPIPICEPLATTTQEAAAHIRSGCGSPVLLGTGIHKNMDFFRQAVPRATILPERFNHPAPETLLHLAQGIHYSDAPVEPLYIRGCDAEENLGTIAASKGLDPEEAKNTLERLTSS